MKLETIFNQLLGAASKVAGGAQTQRQGNNWNGLAGGALAGGVMGVLMGSKGTRKFVGKAATYGGMAVLGGLAYQAFQNWQQSKSQGAAPLGLESQSPLSASLGAPLGLEQDSIGRFQGSPALELVLVKSMIASSKADGHVDAEEQKRIFEFVQKAELTSEQKASVLDLLGREISVEEIANSVDSDEHRAEVYVAAYLGGKSEDERVRNHLARVAQALRLPPDLVTHLERQATSGLSIDS
jgi:uncharacterized membrane protein YebE (DUF533 family)